jgi:glycosyltransferase involved in cell wall biosynthesis
VYRGSEYFMVSTATRGEVLELGVRPDPVAVGYARLHDDGTRFVVDEALRSPSLVTDGRLVPHKRIEVAIDVVAAWADHFPDLVLRVVGTGYRRADLESYAAARGVADRVVFTGPVDKATKRAC